MPACGNTDTHPGNVPSDCEMSCGAAVVGGPGQSGAGGTAGAAGAGGAAGTAGAGGDAGAGGSAVKGVHATGSVQVFTNSAFTTTAVYGQAALVNATAFDPSQPISAMWDGSTSFTLQGVATGKAIFSATPTATSQDTLGGAVTVDVPVDGLDDVKVPVVDTGVISAILGTIQGSPVINPGAGHVILSFVDDQKNPLSNVTVTPSFPATTLYDDGPNYSDGQTRTRGVAALLNATPAAASTVAYKTKDGRTGSVNVLVSKAVVFFTTVVINP
jgi:hypothetical protein